MKEPASDEEFARAFAPLLEVEQNGRFRTATASDVLEILEYGGGRWVLKGKRGYLAKKGWSPRQRDAIVAPDKATAQHLRGVALREHGVAVKVVRVRRKGTCGVVAVRLRAGLPVTTDANGNIGLGVGEDEAMGMLTALLGGKKAEGEQ